MIPSYFETDLVDWNANPFYLKFTLESVVDWGDKCFEIVEVYRQVYIPPLINRWVGGYI